MPEVNGLVSSRDAANLEKKNVAGRVGVNGYGGGKKGGKCV